MAALTAPGGFYRRGGARQFRTAARSELFAAALLRLIQTVDTALARPARLQVVDVGAGGGELLTALAALADRELASRLDLLGVDVETRPDQLPAVIGWSHRLPAAISGCVVAHEWLDTVPIDVVERTPAGLRVIEVNGRGEERRAGKPTARDAAWVGEYWPGAQRAEVGWRRDVAWRALVRRVRAGLAVAIDYQADPTVSPLGTLTGYRDGRQVRPLPDGRTDITAHVLFGSLIDPESRLLTQAEALERLGPPSSLPPRSAADNDPGGYLRTLVRIGERAELARPTGWGGFGWLVRAVGMPHPDDLVGSTAIGASD